MLQDFTPGRDRSESLYRQLYRGLAEAIKTGRLAPGTRLPPTRVLAEQLGLSRQTVIAAYQELHADGLVGGHVGRGTFVMEPAGDLAA